MSKYYVRKEKMERLERAFRADLREIKRLKIRFNMSSPAFLDVDARRFVAKNRSGKKCGVCLVGAHVVACQVEPDDEYNSDLTAAAKDLRVNVYWLESLYMTFAEDDVKQAEYPQAAKLARRLQKYAEEIGA